MNDITNELQAVMRDAASNAVAQVDTARLSDRLVTRARSSRNHRRHTRARMWVAPPLVALAVAVIALASAAITASHDPHKGHSAIQPTYSTASQLPATIEPATSPAATTTITPSSTTSATTNSSTASGMPANCLTPRQALAIVQQKTLELINIDQSNGYLCDGSWAVVNYHYAPPHANHATVDLHYVNGTWVEGDRVIACGTSANAMSAPLQAWGCGN